MRSSGQVALIVLLISAAAMTIGLSVSRKTVMDTRIEANEEQLKQAFNTAESGIDYYLGTGSTKFVAPDNLSQADVRVTNVGQGTTINFNQVTLVNKSQEFWLVGHAADGSIDDNNFYQGNSLIVCVKAGFSGSVKVDYFYLDGALTYQVSRAGYNLNSAGYVTGYTDMAPVQGSCVTGYRAVSLTVPIGGGQKPLLLAVKPLKNVVSMYLLGNGQDFPVQGIELSSTGKVGDVSRKINVSRVYQVPGFALEAITTFGDVLSN